MSVSAQTEVETDSIDTSAFDKYLDEIVIVAKKPGTIAKTDRKVSTVMMPSGIPVATVAVNGGVNAALLAAQIIAVEDGDLAARLDQKRAADARKVLEKDAALQAELN